MKATIITCFESNEERAAFVLEALDNKGYKCEVITSDFSHVRKAKRDNIPKGYVSIDTRAYKKNISISRILSHICFAKDAFEYVRNNIPDLIYLLVPANSLIKQAKKFKKDYPNVKIIIDVVDMWPESLPVNFDKHFFPFSIWRNVRKNSIDCADSLISECDFYQSILKEEYSKDIKTIYWARDSKAERIAKNLTDDKLSLVYIGSINNIIDIDMICEIIKNIDKDVLMHVIGDGESKDEFILKLSKVCEVIYHGVIRDEKKKEEIFSRCHGGINIYKKGLYIGLTVKCIDYFEHGLPIINNIVSDTWKLVDEFNVGFNVDENSRLNSEDIIKMAKDNRHIYRLFDEYFSKEIFIRKCFEVVDEV